MVPVEVVVLVFAVTVFVVAVGATELSVFEMALLERSEVFEAHEREL